MPDLPLGRETGYPDRYDASLLCPLPRAEGRAAIGLVEPLPFRGRDLWTAWELTWLDGNGRPVVAVLECDVPADSPNLIESKSLKLYLGSFAMTRFADAAAVAARIRADLSAAAGSDVAVTLVPATAWAGGRIGTLPGDCLDDLDVAIGACELDPSQLACGDEVVRESLHTHLLRSLCPVTGQPDSGSLLIDYRGPRLERAALLRYVVGFRRHAEFHELCVERVFRDLLERCACEALTVYARYNRRGGIDINPFRSNVLDAPPGGRLWRQ